MGQLQDKVAIVTGASQGIGRAVASKYVAEGARVVVADLLYDEAAELCEELNSEHGQSNEPVALPIKTDVSDKHSVAEMVAGTVEAFGRIDTLVNNAALWKALERREFWTIPEEEWDQVFAVNTRGPFLCSAAVTPVMQKQNKGKIICIGSATIWTAQATLTHYVSSKAALIGLVRCMARDLGPIIYASTWSIPGSPIPGASIVNIWKNAASVVLSIASRNRWTLLAPVCFSPAMPAIS